MVGRFLVGTVRRVIRGDVGVFVVIIGCTSLYLFLLEWANDSQGSVVLH